MVTCQVDKTPRVSVVDFYDGLAADYHLVYGDRWDDAVAGQGAALDRFREISWQTGEQAGYHQPLMTARG
jgi:hypothetical protein